MDDKVVCPFCGESSPRRTAEMLGACIRCQADLKGVLASDSGGEAPRDEWWKEDPNPFGRPVKAVPADAAPTYVTGGFGKPSPAGAASAPASSSYPVALPSDAMEDIYGRPPSRAGLDLVKLPKVLLRPGEAFRELYDHTGAAQGIMLTVVFIIISTLVGWAITWALASDQLATAFQLFGSLMTTLTLVSILINVVVGLVIYFLATYLVYILVKSMGNARRPSASRTFGLVGYAKFPGFLFGIALAAATTAWAVSHPPEFGQVNTDGALLYWGLGVPMFIYSLWVHGNAAAVANDASLPRCIGLTFLGWLLAFLVIFGVIFLLSMVLYIAVVGSLGV